MAPEVIAALALLVVFLGIALGIVVWQFAIRRIDWRPIVGSGAMFYGNVSVERMSFALEAAILALAANTGHSEAMLREIADRLQILVVAANEWKDGSGQYVGGQAEGYLLKVDSQLGSLLHEFAHVIEVLTTGDWNAAHRQWLEKGLWSADNAYRRSLGVL